jgi:hypothetical protein
MGSRVFQLAIIAIISLGLAATNQIYAIAGELLPARELGPVMGIVSLGSGVFGYAGPQGLGVLRDWTGGFFGGMVLPERGGDACINRGDPLATASEQRPDPVTHGCMKSLPLSGAYSILNRSYQNPLETAWRKHRDGVPVAGFTSNTVPWELPRAAGFFAVMIQAHAAATPHADPYMEPCSPNEFAVSSTPY